MADLSPNARALIEQSRSALRPNAGDRERIESALRERLGPDVLSADAPSSPSVGLASTRALFRVAIGVCVVGGGVALWALRPNASPLHSTSAPAPGVHLPNPPLSAAPTAPEPESIEPSAPSGPLAALPASGAPRKRDPFAQEVALLARATEQLHLGNAGKALRALQEHQRRFPNGTLSEERRAAKAQALCLMQRVREGRAEQSGLEPNSPAAARAREVCDSAAAASSQR